MSASQAAMGRSAPAMTAVVGRSAGAACAETSCRRGVRCRTASNSAMVTPSTIDGSPAFFRGRPVQSSVKMTRAECWTTGSRTARKAPAMRSSELDATTAIPCSSSIG